MNKRDLVHPSEEGGAAYILEPLCRLTFPGLFEEFGYPRAPRSFAFSKSVRVVHENNLGKPRAVLKSEKFNAPLETLLNDFLNVLRPGGHWSELQLLYESHFEVCVGELHLQSHTFSLLGEALRLEI